MVLTMLFIKNIAIYLAIYSVVCILSIILFKPFHKGKSLDDKNAIFIVFSFSAYVLVFLALILSYQYFINLMVYFGNFPITSYPISFLVVLCSAILYFCITFPIYFQYNARLYCKYRFFYISLFSFFVLALILLTNSLPFFSYIASFFYYQNTDISFSILKICLGVFIFGYLSYLFTCFLYDNFAFETAKKIVSKSYVIMFTILVFCCVIPIFYSQIKVKILGTYRVIPEVYQITSKKVKDSNIYIPKKLSSKLELDKHRTNYESPIKIKAIGKIENLEVAAQKSKKLEDVLKRTIKSDYFEMLQLSSTLLKYWQETSSFSDTYVLENLKLADGTSFKYDISDGVREKLNQLQILETFSANKLIKVRITGFHLTLSYGGRVRVYDITRGAENILTDDIFTIGWDKYQSDWNVSSWDEIVDLNMKAINTGYLTILNAVRKTIFNETEYSKVIGELKFEFDSSTNEIKINFSQVDSYLKDKAEKEPLTALALTIGLVNQWANIKSADWNYQNVLNNISNQIKNKKISPKQIKEFNDLHLKLLNNSVYINSKGDVKY
jgi:hypothetical protein